MNATLTKTLNIKLYLGKLTKAVSSLTKLSKPKILLLTTGSLVIILLAVQLRTIWNNLTYTKPQIQIVETAQKSIRNDYLSETYDEFVMNNKYYGKREKTVKPVQIIKKPEFFPIDLFVKSKTPTDTKPAINPQLEFLTKISQERNFNSQTKVIHYATKTKSNKGKLVNLLTDKDYPRTIASAEYDLSRIIATTSFIPAIMYSAVNSELPSQSVIAVTESNVFGYHGKNILIPRGSKLEGVYEEIESKH